MLASELPANAKAVEEKWTYDETTKITSDKSEVEGYTLYDTTSEWGEYGEWSAWSFNAVSASESRQVEKKSVHTGYYMDTYNTMSTGGARQFRSFSIDGKFSSYGCSSSYGEYHKSTTMTLSEANSVPRGHMLQIAASLDTIRVTVPDIYLHGKTVEHMYSSFQVMFIIRIIATEIENLFTHIG